MHALITKILEDLPPDAYSMYVVMTVITVALIRCSAHPTFFALLAFPGVLAHELAHFSVGAVLGARPTTMSLWPKSLGNGRWQLGSVAFSNLKWWSAPWTAMAPLLMAPISLTIAYWWIYPYWAANEFTIAFPALYVCATMFQASWPSTTDFEVALPGLVLIALVVAIFW